MDGVVYRPVQLASFVKFALRMHERPISLVICADREIFLTQLSVSVENSTGEQQVPLPDVEQEGRQIPQTNQDGTHRRLSPDPLLEQSIRNVFASQYVKTAFCSTVSVLLAHLAIIADQRSNIGSSNGERASPKPMLVVINALSLFQTSSSFSAQDLGRFFSAATEACWAADKQLVLVEAIGMDQSSSDIPRHQHGHGYTEAVEESERASSDVPSRLGPENTLADDPWECEVPVVSSVTRGSTSNNDGPWTGRRLRISSVAKMWLRFESLPHE